MPDSPRRAQGLVAARPVPGHRVRISVAVLAGVAAGIAIAAVAAAHSAAVGAVADQADAAGMTPSASALLVVLPPPSSSPVCSALSPAWKLRDDNGGVSRLAGQLLPAAVRDDYVEEWQAWLNDLHAASEPWHRRLAELLSIVLIAAPRLAVTLRLRRRVVD